MIFNHTKRQHTMQKNTPFTRSAATLSLASLLLAGLLGGCCTYRAPEGEKCEFEFPFMADYDVVNRVQFNWHDSYVTNSPFAYRQEIAGPMIALAASTYGYRLGTDVRSLMDLGFPPERLKRCYGDDLSYHHPKYGRDRVGYTIASRRSELPGADYDIVMVLCRGTFGREEWLSNINMANAWGKDPTLPADKMPQFHEGFSRAADDVMEALAEYVATNRIDLSKAKILVSGHSRGGSVANLIGSRLDAAADGPITNPFSAVRRENVFVYTIASPNVTIKLTPETAEAKYGNIFNVISPEDVVPMLPFPAWSGARYGHTLILKSFNYLPFTGSWTNPGYCDMKDHFKDICGYTYHHMLLGTNITARIPDIALRICPTVANFYWVHPDIRASGDATCTHKVFEMILTKALPSAETQARNISLSGDIATLTSTYDRLVNNRVDETEESRRDHKFRFVKNKIKNDDTFDPDGRDFSRQPGFFDIGWKLTCMHATQTYIAWMKSASENGPDAVFVNWDEECGEKAE